MRAASMQDVTRHSRGYSDQLCIYFDTVQYVCTSLKALDQVWTLTTMLLARQIVQLHLLSALHSPVNCPMPSHMHSKASVNFENFLTALLQDADEAPLGGVFPCVEFNAAINQGKQGVVLALH